MSDCALDRRFLLARPQFEALEPRNLCSADNPTPGDGNDYIFLAAGSDDPVDSIQPQALPAQIAPQNDAFKWLDGTRPLHLAAASSDVAPVFVDSFEIWPRNAQHQVTTHQHADEANTRALARRMIQITDTLIIDIEDWEVDIRYGSRSVVDKTIADFREVLGWIRDEEPSLKLAVYDMFSLADQYRSTALEDPQRRAVADPDSWWAYALPEYMQGYAKWQAANEYLRPIADAVDFIAPSLYTRTVDIDGMWTDFAINVIDDSRRFGKPVIPFVWYRYHNVVPGVGRVPLAADDWQHELDTIRAHADGVIAWAEDDYEMDEPWVAPFINSAEADNVAVQSHSVRSAVRPTSFASLAIASDDQDDDASSLVDLIAA